MCGVFGFSQLTNRTRRMAPFMAFAMEMRGSDSWGGSDGNELIKRVGPIGESFEIPEHWVSGIFHTRAATVGCVSVRNAHPFEVVADGKRVIGIHNGHVSNHELIRNRYNRDCQVDSEHIFYNLVEGKPLEELNGRGTIAWFDGQFNEDGRYRIKLARWNFGDLEVARLKSGEVVFASTKSAIEKAIRFGKTELDCFYSPLSDGFEYYFDINTKSPLKDELYKGKSLGFSVNNFNTATSTTYGYGYGGSRGGGLSYDRHKPTVCFKCRDACTTYLCKKCVELYRKEFKQECARKA